jgi:hypothetical protein
MQVPLFSATLAIVAILFWAIPGPTKRVRATAERLVRGRYLLQDNADRLITQAESSGVLK